MLMLLLHVYWRPFQQPEPGRLCRLLQLLLLLLLSHLHLPISIAVKLPPSGGVRERVSWDWSLDNSETRATTTQSLVALGH